MLYPINKREHCWIIYTSTLINCYPVSTKVFAAKLLQFTKYFVELCADKQPEYIQTLQNTHPKINYLSFHLKHHGAQYTPAAVCAIIKFCSAPVRDAGASTFHLPTATIPIQRESPCRHPLSPVHPPESARALRTPHRRVWKHRRAKINSREMNRLALIWLDAAASLNKLAKCRQGLMRWAPSRVT